MSCTPTPAQGRELFWKHCRRDKEKLRDEKECKDVLWPALQCEVLVATDTQGALQKKKKITKINHLIFLLCKAQDKRQESKLCPNGIRFTQYCATVNMPGQRPAHGMQLTENQSARLSSNILGHTYWLRTPEQLPTFNYFSFSFIL